MTNFPGVSSLGRFLEASSAGITNLLWFFPRANFIQFHLVASLKRAPLNFQFTMVFLEHFNSIYLVITVIMLTKYNNITSVATQWEFAHCMIDVIYNVTVTCYQGAYLYLKAPLLLNIPGGLRPGLIIYLLSVHELVTPHWNVNKG